MSWYAAHLIMYFKRKKGTQKRFLVWENVVLVRANSSDEAYEKAEKRGRQEEIFDGTDRIGGHPSTCIFAGVRKVTLCQDQDSRPTDGTEVTYIEMSVRSEAAVKKLAAGKTVTVEIVDPFPDDDVVSVGDVPSLRTRTGS